MSTHGLFVLIALVCFAAASIVAAIHKSWIAALFCAAVFFLALSSTDLIHG